MSKQKIVSIEIELKDYEPIKFTMAEAKELHEQLDALFGAKQQHNHYHDNPWWYTRPYYTWYNSAGVGVSTLTNTTNTAADYIGLTASSAETEMKVSYLSQ